MRTLLALCVATAVVGTVAGCQTYGYQPGFYGPPGGAVYPTPAQPAPLYAPVPSGTYVPGAAPTPTPIQGMPGLSPTPTPLNSTPGGAAEPTWKPDPMGDAPPFNADPGSSDRPVPPPGNEDFGRDPNGSATDDGFETPFNSTQRVTPGGTGTTVAANSSGAPAFQPSAPPAIQTASASVAAPNPYAYDAIGYAWLRGVVEFDAAQRRWYLMYNINPDPNDKYGGVLPLGDHKDLLVLQNDDIVLVEGQLDSASVDQAGKPIYRVGRMQLLKPKTP